MAEGFKVGRISVQYKPQIGGSEKNSGAKRAADTEGPAGKKAKGPEGKATERPRASLPEFKSESKKSESKKDEPIKAADSMMDQIRATQEKKEKFTAEMGDIKMNEAFVTALAKGRKGIGDGVKDLAS